MANAGVEYMATRVSTPASLALNCRQELSPILSPFNLGGEWRKDYILRNPSQVEPETPAVATLCSNGLFNLVTP